MPAGDDLVWQDLDRSLRIVAATGPGQIHQDSRGGNEEFSSLPGFPPASSLAFEPTATCTLNKRDGNDSSRAAEAKRTFDKLGSGQAEGISWPFFLGFPTPGGVYKICLQRCIRTVTSRSLGIDYQVAMPRNDLFVLTENLAEPPLDPISHHGSAHPPGNRDTQPMAGQIIL